MEPALARRMHFDALFPEVIRVMWIVLVSILYTNNIDLIYLSKVLTEGKVPGVRTPLEIFFYY